MSLSGSLHHTPLVELLQIFQRGKKSGVLLLFSEMRRGTIYIHDGDPIDAQVIDSVHQSPLTTRDDALDLMLRWDNATYQFYHDSIAAPRPVRMEWAQKHPGSPRTGARHVPTCAFASEHTLSAETRLRLASHPFKRGSMLGMHAAHREIVGYFRHTHTVLSPAMIARTTGMNVSTTLRLVGELAALGILEVVASHTTDA